MQARNFFYVVECDNGPDYVKEGLFRIMDEKGLMGFADSSGHIIITPQFKFAYPFEEERLRLHLRENKKSYPGLTAKNIIGIVKNGDI